MSDAFWKKMLMDGIQNEQVEWQGQHLAYIKLDDLVLWSENPRDPLDEEADNDAIIKKALEEDSESSRWQLAKLAKEMGDDYDFSELPTVVPIDNSNKYRVYDGNRRVILAILRSRGETPGESQIRLPVFPDTMPCNVCTKDVALRHVFRKHNDSGSWMTYERDLFAYKYMRGKKTVLIKIEEYVDGITRFPSLNQRYVKEDVLNDKHMREFGFDLNRNDYGVSPETFLEFLKLIASEVMSDGSLSTRGARNNPIEVIPQSLLEKIRGVQQSNDVDGDEVGCCDDPNAASGGEECGGKHGKSGKAGKKRKTRVTKPTQYDIFGGTLSLRLGETNNLYSTLDALWALNEKNKIPQNASFIPIFRMGLRLLADQAAKDEGVDLAGYVKEHFDSAKKDLVERTGSRDVATYLRAHNVTKESTLSLLQSGAHANTSTNSRDQAIALSLILSGMLNTTHRREG